MAQAGGYRPRETQEKLAEVLVNSRVEANRLHSLPDCYKIKLRSSRLVYQVIDHEVVVFVVAVDRTVSRRTARPLSGSINALPASYRVWFRCDE